MRIPLIAANWKMKKTSGEAAEFASKLIRLVKDVKGAEILICPPYTALATVYNITAHTNILLGAQNMHYEEDGAYTGEISANMLKDIGCEYVILGHSERRRYFGEDDKTVNMKVRKALEYKLRPIICVGETLEQKKAGKTKKVLESQITTCLQGVEDISSIVIAYEPVWAISGGDPTVKPASPEDAQDIHAYIRGLVEKLYGKEAADSTRILYGGSMKPDNAKELLAQPDIDGGLIGGASLEPESFHKIISAL